MDLTKIMELSKGEFQEKFGDLIHVGSFSAYLSGDQSDDSVNALKKDLKDFGVPEEFWNSRDKLEAFLKTLAEKAMTV